MHYILSGKVVRGEGYGKKLGFPTANLDRRSYARQKLKIRLGVYAGTAQLKNSKVYKAGIVIGPKDRKGLPKIEAYLLGFKGTLYGKHLTLTLQKFLRSFKNYESEDWLKRQIAEDVKKVKKLYGKT